jgi:hypothetical protein
LQWLEDSSEILEYKDNLNNVKLEASRYIRYTKREYLKDKIKNKNIRDLYRGINEFNRVYQPGNYLVKDRNGDMLANFHNILNRRKTYFSQLLNVQNVSG